MTIDAIITMMVLPYTINIETKEQELERLHQNMSLSTEPIVSLQTLKQTFNENNYQVKTYKYEELSLKPGVDNSTLPLTDSIKEILQRIKDREMIKEGKQYIELTKQDIKELFSIELLRVNKLKELGI